MDWIGLALSILKIVNWCLNQINREQIRQDARRELLAEQNVLLMQKIGKSKATMEWARGLTEPQVDEELRKLEPGGGG